MGRRIFGVWLAAAAMAGSGATGLPAQAEAAQGDIVLADGLGQLFDQGVRVLQNMKQPTQPHTEPRRDARGRPQSQDVVLLTDDATNAQVVAALGRSTRTWCKWEVSFQVNVPSTKPLTKSQAMNLTDRLMREIVRPQCPQVRSVWLHYVDPTGTETHRSFAELRATGKFSYEEQNSEQKEVGGAMAHDLLTIYRKGTEASGDGTPRN